MRVPALPPSLDAYQGWEPPSSEARIARVSNDISAEEMWTNFISTRQPVIIDGHLQDLEWKGHKWTDLDYLKRSAGKVPVKIEPIHPSTGHFGTSAKRKQVSFTEYIDMLQDAESAGQWYLTTQYTDHADCSGHTPSSSAVSSSDIDTDTSDDEHDDNEPELDPVLPAPTNALSNDFPKNPQLLGSLVLQQCNLWLGNSKEGKSSGLHHDFHDNLYILLSGYKRFLLFPPSAHRYLYPRGIVDRVHPNGLIVYAPPGELPSYLPGHRPQMPIRPDGLVPSDAARWRRKARLRVKREIDERAAAEAGEGLKGKHQRKGKAKQTRAQELAEQALLQAEAELRLCLMDEEGIDPEANTSDEDSSEVGSQGDSSLEGSLDRLFAPSTPLADFNDLSSRVDEESDDDDNQVRSLMDSMPASMRPIAAAALAGDPVAIDKLHLYLKRTEQDEESEEQANDIESEIEGDAHGSQKDGPNGNLSEEYTDENSDAEDSSCGDIMAISKIKAVQQDDGHSDHLAKTGSGSIHLCRAANESLRPAPFASIKRKNSVSTVDSSLKTASGELQYSKDPDRKSSRNGAAKRPKIIKVNEGSESSLEHSEDDEDFHQEGLSDSRDEEEDGSTTDSNEPILPEMDSSSEFGDVKDGEAELERLLLLSEARTEAFGQEHEVEENEPQSFSRISPSTLHAHWNLPDDPSTLLDKGNRDSERPRGKQRALDSPRPLLGCPKPLEVFLTPGQMLYLPASWYHEVTSSSWPPGGITSDPNTSHHEPLKVHMALNYWFHPPDALAFQPGRPAPSSSTGEKESEGNNNDPHVPGLGVGLGESAAENIGSGTGTYQRPYRDAEVWDEITRAVNEHIELARQQAGQWATTM